MKTVQLLLIVTFVGLVTAGGESQSCFVIDKSSIIIFLVD